MSFRTSMPAPVSADVGPDPPPKAASQAGRRWRWKLAALPLALHYAWIEHKLGYPKHLRLEAIAFEWAHQWPNMTPDTAPESSGECCILYNPLLYLIDATSTI